MAHSYPAAARGFTISAMRGRTYAERALTVLRFGGCDRGGRKEFFEALERPASSQVLKT